MTSQCLIDRSELFQTDNGFDGRRSANALAGCFEWITNSPVRFTQLFHNLLYAQPVRKRRQDHRLAGRHRAAFTLARLGDSDLKQRQTGKKQ